MIKKSDPKRRGEFRYLTDLRIPGFLKTVPAGTIQQLDFDSRSSLDWYNDFLNEINSAVGRRYLPIYRMADGEFIFCVGLYPDLLNASADWRARARYLINSIRFWLKRRFAGGAETCWGESYASENLQQLQAHYVKCLRVVAQYGKLALHFTRSPEKFSEQYIHPVNIWLANNDVPITAANYLPFYFIYGLLCGPDGLKLIQGKNILIVTSANEKKRERIATALQAKGANSVQFSSISPNKSLLDRIDLHAIYGKIDLVLIGAGIGSVNILEQLRPLNTVCIDAGICIEIFADDSLRNRIFTVPDSIAR